MNYAQPSLAAVFASVIAAIFLLCMTSAVQSVYANRFQSNRTAQMKQESLFDAKQREESSKNPPNISFTIRLAEGKKRFRQGEAIRLELAFASDLPKTYRMDAATYDRSGRLDMDKFYIDPESGFVDPMRDHVGGIMGGIRAIPELEKKPYQIIYELNEWFRFEKPGKYRLYLTSPRVSLIGKRDGSGDLSLTSNIVEFEIIPAEPDWLEKELQRFIKALDAKDPNLDRRSACRGLRFLGSKASALEMVRRYGDSDSECGFEYYAGLIGSPHRDFVIERMEHQLALPEQPVSGSWLDLLVRLVMNSSHHGLQKPTTQDQQQWGEYWRRHQNLYEQIRANYADLLAKSILLKTGRARAISVNTLLGLGWEKTKLPDAASFFGDLPPQQQRMMLEYGWNRIADKSLLPILRHLYRKPKNDSPEVNWEISEVNSLALKRIYELSPEEGRRLIIDEMRRPKPKVSKETLSLLPDETLPELTHVFADNLEIGLKKGRESEVHSALIERYASPDILPRVMALLDQQVGSMACYEQSRLLAYCLRVNAPGSIELIRRAVNARGKENSRCYSNVLREVGALHSTPELEKLAIEYLDDADIESVIDAVAMLGQNGSADAEEALWRRFEKWHREWSGRGDELNVDFRDNNPIRLQRSLEGSLRNALSHSPAWLADLKKLEQLKQLCVTLNERQQVEHLINSWRGEIRISFAPAEYQWGHVGVAHYNLSSLSSLKNKLEQFPKGTIFRWQPFNQGHLDEEKEKLFRELESFLEERGLKLIR